MVLPLANSSSAIRVLSIATFAIIHLSTICISDSSLKLNLRVIMSPLLIDNSFSDVGFAMSGAQRKLPILASPMELSSWEGNLIDTRTKMIVGVIP